MYFWKYILAKKAGLSQKKCNMALYGLPVLPIAEAFEKTVTGNPISVSDALAQDALSLQVSFTPTQDGTPSIDSEPTTEPYLSKVIPRGNKEYYSLVGGTVAWNQLVPNNQIRVQTSGPSNWGTLGSFWTSFVKDHKYLVMFNGNTVANGNIGVRDADEGIVYRPNSGYALIYNATISTNGTSQIQGQWNDGTVDAYLNFIDLTIMFGSTIADYIYNLEQATAGSGVAYFKSLFPKDYYPYNPGELISVNTSGHKVGSTTYPIDNIDLRGLFKLSNGKLYCEGDIYPPSGSVSRKYSTPIDLGSVDWFYFSSYGLFYSMSITGYKDGTPFISTLYIDQGAVSVSRITNLCGTLRGNAFYLKNTAYTDATAFKAAMSGVYFIAELETPTTESATPYTSPIDVEAGGTEEFVDNRTVPIPVGNETYYASEYEIHGKTGVTVSHGATQDDPNPTEHEVEFTSQGTVYGGTVDIVSGVLSVTWGYIASYNGETLTGIWMSSKDVYTEGTTPSTGAEVAYELATPQTYQLTPQQVQMLLGNNYLETEDGTITLTYMAGK